MLKDLLFEKLSRITVFERINRLHVFQVLYQSSHTIELYNIIPGCSDQSRGRVWFLCVFFCVFLWGFLCVFFSVFFCVFLWEFFCVFLRSLIRRTQGAWRLATAVGCTNQSGPWISNIIQTNILYLVCIFIFLVYWLL